MGEGPQTLKIINSICKWNEARYPQEYNSQLTRALLTEEVKELRFAEMDNDLLEELDAYGDIFYVAIGGMWKLGSTAEEINEFVKYSHRYVSSISFEDMLGNMRYEAPVRYLMGFARLSFEALLHYTRSDRLALQVLFSICTSNDTKAIKKTAAHLKANITKGDEYISPHEELKMIIRKIGREDGLLCDGSESS